MCVNSTGITRHSRALFACLLLLHGCTSLQPDRQTPAGLPPAVELAATAFVPQTEHQCGPAALATVLQSYGREIAPEAITPYLYLPGRQGSLQIEMAATARRFGMLAYPLDQGMDAMLSEIAAGHPVLVLQNLRFGWWPQWHYAVVVGYNIEGSELILRSGTTKRWLTSFANFEQTWLRADQWALVIVPIGTVPASANLSNYLKSVYAFEETAMTETALSGYRAATERWPDAAEAWLALGNLAYLAGDGGDAVSALQRAAMLNPGNVVIWNNLAYALQQQGCNAQALESLQCAYRLSPDDENIRDSEQEIKNMTLQPQSGDCPVIGCN